MYAVYTTRGFIVASSPSGETSKTYSIYTEDFGLIRARAQGVRLLRSKLRYNLDDYAFVGLSLVRGKEFWRITGVSAAETAGISSPKGDASLVRARVLNLVRRLVHGEERNERLFAALLLLTDREAGGIDEASILALALDALGYLDAASLASKAKSERIAAINAAIRETQL